MSRDLAYGIMSGLHALSSFAGGWAQMKFQLDRQALIENKWQQEFQQAKAFHDESMTLAKQRFKLALQQDVRAAELDEQRVKNAKLNYALMTDRQRRAKRAEEHTLGAWDMFTSSLPSIYSLSGAEAQRRLGEITLESFSKYPFADKSMLNLFTTLTESGLLGGKQPRIELQQITEGSNTRYMLINKDAGTATPVAGLSPQKSKEFTATVNTVKEKYAELRANVLKEFKDTASMQFSNMFTIQADPVMEPGEKLHDIMEFHADLTRRINEKLPELRSFARSMFKGFFIDSDGKLDEDSLDIHLNQLYGPPWEPLEPSQVKGVIKEQFDAYLGLAEEGQEIDEVELVRTLTPEIINSIPDQRDLAYVINPYLDYLAENFGVEVASEAAKVVVPLVYEKYGMDLSGLSTKFGPVVEDPSKDYPGSEIPPEGGAAWRDTPMSIPWPESAD